MRSKLQLIQTIVVFVVIASAGIGWYVRKSEMGSKFAFNDKESVNYSGVATEAQASALAEALSREGFFDGQTEKDVLLKVDGQQKTVSFVVQDGKWDDVKLQKIFQNIGESIAPVLGGLPLMVRLTNDGLVSKYETPISAQRLTVNFSEQEKVIQRSKVIDNGGKELGDILHKLGYFDGSAPAAVVLDQSSDKTIIGFVVQEGKEKEDAVVKYYSDLVTKIAPLMGKSELTIQLMDSSFNPSNTWEQTVP